LSHQGLMYALVEFMQADEEQRPTLHHTVDAFFDMALCDSAKLQLVFLEKIAGIERGLGAEASSPYATTLLSLGRTYQRQGDLDRAEACLREALEIERRLGQHPRQKLAQHLTALALLCAATGRPAEALELMREVSQIETYLVGQVFTTGSESQR